MSIAFVPGFFADMVYQDSGWNYRDAKLDDALRAADAKTARVLNATDPNLRPFQGHGGKLIMYHGWDDPAISALNTINYYDAVVGTLGKSEVDSFVRLYMVPGMQHCDGGPGPDSFGAPGAAQQTDPRHDMQAALQVWVEKGFAPGSIVATKYDDKSHTVKMTRPLCPYPQSAKYKGTGDPNDAANFTCAPGEK
jgi:Tannase and feruloyl esterase